MRLVKMNVVRITDDASLIKRYKAEGYVEDTKTEDTKIEDTKTDKSSNLKTSKTP